jgi:hypothetical protein
VGKSIIHWVASASLLVLGTTAGALAGSESTTDWVAFGFLAIVVAAICVLWFRMSDAKKARRPSSHLIHFGNG